MFRLIRLVVSRVLLLGVNVPIQVTPPSWLVSAERLPLGTFRSLLSKPLTASENVTVTKEVSPAFNTGSAITMVAVGRRLSII